MTDKQVLKQKAIHLLTRQVDAISPKLEEIDHRLVIYYQDLINHSGVELGDENDNHNLYELLAALKFSRLLLTYEFDVEKVKQVIYLREGDWHQEGKK